MYELRHEVQEGEQGRWVSFYINIIWTYECYGIVFLSLSILGEVMWRWLLLTLLLADHVVLEGQCGLWGGWGVLIHTQKGPGSARAK